MKRFDRDNLKNKQNYYKILIIIELLLLLTLCYFKINWIFIILIFPIICIDLYSNKRCLNRQKNFIKSVEFDGKNIIWTHFKNNKTILPYKDVKFSIREVKFEKNRMEIELKQKKFLKSKLIGRLHINNWSNLVEIKNEFIKNSIVQIKYRPEGFWSTYGIFATDIVITTTAIGFSEFNGGFEKVSFPINDIKEAIKPSEEEN